MKKHRSSIALRVAVWVMVAAGSSANGAESYPRPLRELYTSYFPFDADGVSIPEGWAKRKEAIRERIQLAAGLYPMPTKPPLNAVIHGRIERDDYTIDRVFFESFPGHFVCGNLYLPKALPNDKKIPGILCPHGHWPKGRFMDLGSGTAATKEQLAIGAERFENGARSPLQARCVQLARMGCAVFFYDMLGNADSIQIADHRSGRRAELCGTEPGSYGLYSPMAEMRLQSNFGLQTWNSIRALDFLLTMPCVDPDRISCTGASGGGTQTLILAAIDDRIATAFPCVMTSTAMQGGCTCENANYLRINQGNVDIAACFAPKPMGMTAADDWTKELETKGFPDLKMVWNKLGAPNNISATYNIHWKHNYNHVSRAIMYGFMSKNLKLGFSLPVLERDFVFSTPEELTVWTAAHPKPSGNDVGAEHEKRLLKYWSEDSDKQIGDNKDILSKAWNIIVGRSLSGEKDVVLDTVTVESKDEYVVARSTIKDSKHNESIPVTFFTPKHEKWNGTTVIWLTSKDVKSPEPGMLKLIDAGNAVVIPELYLPNATKNPWNPVKGKDQNNHDGWEWSACYTYGYNPPLLVRRVHDVMNTLLMVKNHERKSKRVVLVAGNKMGAVGALAAVVLNTTLDYSVIDTEGFRFSALKDPMDTMFVPGAVKYGDIPGLLKLIDAAKLKALGEGDAKSGGEALIDAALTACSQ